VEQTAGEGDKFHVCGIRRLGEHRGGTGPGRVRQLKPGTPVGAVITQHHRDIADHSIGMVAAYRFRHPRRCDLVPAMGMVNSATVI
jgi:hypothetical protein